MPEEIPQEYLDHLEPPPGGDATPGEGEESSTPEAPASTPVEDSDLELYEGYKVTRTEARQLADFRDWIRDHPDQALAFSGYLQGQYRLEPTQAPTKAEPEPEDDDTDPRVKALEQRLSLTENELRNQQAVMARTALSRAQSTFTDEHRLTAQELEEIANHAQKMQILPGIAEQLKQEGKADAVEAVRRTLEAAYWSMPKMREREMERARADQKAQQQKDRKLAGISGTSGSVPHTTPPSTPEERRAAMVAELSAAMGRSEES